ncbi:MAG: hypothetical protein WBC24_00910, partial [Methylovirgula sp.]
NYLPSETGATSLGIHGIRATTTRLAALSMRAFGAAAGYRCFGEDAAPLMPIPVALQIVLSGAVAVLRQWSLDAV